jgi:hypothetical protein
MVPTAIGFLVELNMEEWGEMAIEHPIGFSDQQSRAIGAYVAVLGCRLSTS